MSDKNRKPWLKSDGHGGTIPPSVREQVQSLPWYQRPAYLIYAGDAGTDPSRLREWIVWFTIGALYLIPFLAALGFANLIARVLF